MPPVGDQLPELPATPRTQLYNAEALERGLETFEREGLWLLLSLQHYGYRAHADLAALLVGDTQADDLGDDFGEHHREHRAMAGLEELFLALDQLWRLISGIKSHRDGEGFLAGYRRHGDNIANEFAALQALTEDDWREILGIPPEEQLDYQLRERGVNDPNDLAHAHELAADVLATCVRNMQEVGVFFVRTDPIAGLAGRSLRDINNAYRHGTQVVYEDCSPEEIPWRAANPEEAQGMLVAADEVDELARAEIVNVLLEGPDEEGHARFASMPRNRETNDSLVESMRHLSVLMFRIVSSFLVAELQGGYVISALDPLDWDALEERVGPQHGADDQTQTD
jgi:hypothetical protein